jgi:hypothetical protein
MLAAFLAGAVASVIAIAIFVDATYRCTAGPCDAGPMTGLAVSLFIAPFVGAICAYAVHRHIARRDSQWHDA